MRLLFTVTRQKIFGFLFFWLIFFSFLSDILNGFLVNKISISPGLIIRGGGLVWGVLVALSFGTFERKRPLLLLVLILFMSVVFNWWSSQVVNFKLEVAQHLKLLFVPIFSYLLFFFLKDQEKPSKNLFFVIVVSSVVLSISILLPKIFGFDTLTYGDLSYGSRGILLNPNDIALSLAIGQIVIAFLCFYTKKIIYVASLICVSLALFLLGTRTSITSSFMLPFLLVFVVSTFGKNDKSAEYRLNRKKMIIFFIVISCFLPVAYEFLVTQQYIVKKFTDLNSSLNVRGRLMEVGLFVLSKGNISDILFGQGTTEFYHNVQRSGHFYSFHSWGKRVEVDWIDVAGSYGFFVLFFVYYYYLKFFWGAVRLFKKDKDIAMAPVALGLLVFIVHSVWAGHAVMSPLPGTYIASFISLIMVKQYQEENR